MTATKIVALLFAAALSSCATTSTRDRVLRDLLIGGGVGALLAQTKEKNRGPYTAMYFGIGAAAVGAGSVYLNVANNDQILEENVALKVRIKEFEKQLKPELVEKGNSLFTSRFPKELTGLIEPGEWRRYKMDQWVQDPYQSNTWYRQTEMFEIIPPVSK